MIHYILLFASLLNTILLTYSTIYWYIIWKEKESRAAVGLFVSLLLIFVLVIYADIYTVKQTLAVEKEISYVSLFMISISLTFSIVQFLLTQGYFYRRKK